MVNDRPKRSPLLWALLACFCHVSGSIEAHWNSTELTRSETSYAFGRRMLSKATPDEDTSHGCTLSSCNGLDLLSAIKKDFKPWSDKGGITARDIDAAEKSLSKVEGYIRVSIIDGQLYASHLGKSWGTRDGVFLVSLLEMLRNPKLGQLPKNVEFVLSTMDRVQLPRTSAHGKDSTPFALSFARNPSHLDVAIPDPSFWAWPEMLIPPYWELVHDAKIAKWADKPMRAFWRGGTARNSGLREVLIHCGKNSKHRGKGVTFDMKNAVRNWPKTWAGPMDTCQYKLAVFAQGYGYTSAKERNLACGSVPIFLEKDDVDTYFGRWLSEGTHFRRLRPDSMCDDLDDTIDWVMKDDAAAMRMGNAARQFALSVFSKDMLNGYVAAVLNEAASLQKHSPSTRGMVQLTHKNIGKVFDAASQSAGEKGSTKDGEKGGPIDAAIAALQGKPCPSERCPKCCFRSPKSVAANGADVEAEASEGSWWRRHKNSSFAFWKVQKCKDEEDPKACTAGLEEKGSPTSSSLTSSSSQVSVEASSKPRAERAIPSRLNSSPESVKLQAARAHVAQRLKREVASSSSSSSKTLEVSPEIKGQKHEGAKAYWKLKAERQRKAKAGG